MFDHARTEIGISPDDGNNAGLFGNIETKHFPFSLVACDLFCLIVTMIYIVSFLSISAETKYSTVFSRIEILITIAFF